MLAASAAAQGRGRGGGGGVVGGGEGLGGGGGGGGGAAGTGFNSLWSWVSRPLADPGFLGGYPFEAKKRGLKKGWEGVPVLTTYTPSARGLGRFLRNSTNDKFCWGSKFSIDSR